MNALRIAGYAALFGVADAGRDTILPGAFRETLRSRRTPFPLYWQHHPEQRIGWVETVGEDARGLRVIGRVSRASAAGREAAAAIAQGMVDGLSFGYRVKAARGAGPRELLALELVEVSVVTHPMQPMARVVAVEG